MNGMNTPRNNKPHIHRLDGQWAVTYWSHTMRADSFWTAMYLAGPVGIQVFRPAVRQ